MIRCTLIHISRNKRGQAIRQAQLVESDHISIGRAADCRIHLADHRVSLHHATIRRSDDGRLYIEGEGNPLSIDGSIEQNSELVAGKRILVGPYELVVEGIPDTDALNLSYELVHPLSESGSLREHQSPMTLEATGLSKRRISMWLGSMIAVLFLIVPIIYALSPTMHKMLEKLPMTPDESWNAGNMSPGHRALTTKCTTCHQKPFQPVGNQACESCHKNLAPHIPDPKLHQEVFMGKHCSECHLDHRGRKGLVRNDNQQCVICHGNITNLNPKTLLSNIHDFGGDHPAFRLSVRSGPGQHDTLRIRQSEKEKLVEHSGLKFSHEVHLDKALIELIPDGRTRDIRCDDCHKPDDAGRGFEPMTMASTCQQSKCHSLEFDPPVEGRHVPHASVRTVMTALREYFASKALHRLNTSEVDAGNVRSLRERAMSETSHNAEFLFTQSKEGTCLECHEISRNNDNIDAPWSVEDVHINDRWLPNARFPHSKHQTSKCKDCHDIRHSDKSSDIAIPDIRNCRECHVGSKQTKTQVASTCNTCHTFHGVSARQSHYNGDMALE